MMKAGWLAVMAVLLFQSCEKPLPAALGHDQVINVICDEENWEISQPILSRTLGKVFHTPRTETLYTFQRVEPEALNANRLAKNILIITRLEPASGVTAQVRSMLPDTLISRIRQTSGAVYSRRDAYAKGQALVVVIAKSRADLRQRLEQSQEQIFNFIESTMFERNTAFIYRSGEQFELAEQYFDQYGFYLRMMHDYVEIENNPEKHLVWLGRCFPYRWLVISWVAPDDSTELEVQTRRLLKNTLGKKIGSVRLNEEYLTSEPIWFKEYAAVKYYGLWGSKTEVKGGPLLAYSFFEPVKDRIYCLAGLVHAPDREKMYYLRQAETIFRTFATQIYEPE